jgi:SOS-response transcriptional repressor LexA
LITITVSYIFERLKKEVVMSKKRELEPWEHEECMTLKHIIEEHNKNLPRSQKITQSQIGEELNMTQGGVSLYLNGKNALNLDIAIYFARKLNISIAKFSQRLQQQYDDLLNTKAVNEQSPTYITPNETRKLPILGWVQAGEWADAEDESLISGNRDLKYESTEIPVSEKSFWLRVIGDSMTSQSGISIPEGYLILVDTNRCAENGDLVVAKLTDSNEVTFKKLVIDAGQKYLKPLNPSYRTMNINGNCKIIGVVREVKLKL